VSRRKQRRPICVIDCETDPFLKHRVPQPFVWGFYDGGTGENPDDDGYCDDGKFGFRHFDTNKQIAEFLAPYRFICYAHNGGKFDYHYLWPFISPYRTMLIIDGRVSKFHIGQCEMRDSYNIIHAGLAAFKKQKFDYRLMERSERDKPAVRAKILAYLESDCVNLFDLVTQFIETYGVQLTQASTALAMWRKISKRKVPRSDADYYEQFKPYYYGGRVSVFEAGIIPGPFTLIDINSAYPFAMKQQHPYSLKSLPADGNDAQDLYESSDDDQVGGSFFTVKGVSRGALPSRPKVDDKIEFPNDDQVREYHVTGWELEAAIDTGTFDCHEFVTACRHVEFVSFSEYVDHFYRERLAAKQRNDRAADIFNKNLMNSLYGKMGADPSRYKDWQVIPYDAEHAAKYDPRNETISDEDGRVWVWAGWLPGTGFALISADVPLGERRYYNVATAASITGCVRAQLWRAICQCDGVIYCDTDSIVARSIAGVQLGKQLGEWDIEGEFSEAAVAGRKLYALRYINPKGHVYKTASKGVRLTGRQIYSVARGKTVVYVPDVPTYSIRSEIRFHNRSVRMLPEIARLIHE
jgi:hypothetical protein